MSEYTTSTSINENIKFFIDELYDKIPDWSEYDLDDLDKLIEIVSKYPIIFPTEYEDKFQEIKEEFHRKKNKQ